MSETNWSSAWPTGLVKAITSIQTAVDNLQSALLDLTENGVPGGGSGDTYTRDEINTLANAARDAAIATAAADAQIKANAAYTTAVQDAVAAASGGAGDPSRIFQTVYAPSGMEWLTVNPESTYDAVNGRVIIKSEGEVTLGEIQVLAFGGLVTIQAQNGATFSFNVSDGGQFRVRGTLPAQVIIDAIAIVRPGLE